jgi:hypothetical protein
LGSHGDEGIKERQTRNGNGKTSAKMTRQQKQKTHNERLLLLTQIRSAQRLAQVDSFTDIAKASSSINTSRFNVDNKMILKMSI